MSFTTAVWIIGLSFLIYGVIGTIYHWWKRRGR